MPPTLYSELKVQGTNECINKAQFEVITAISVTPIKCPMSNLYHFHCIMRVFVFHESSVVVQSPALVMFVFSLLMSPGLYSQDYEDEKGIEASAIAGRGLPTAV